MGRAKLNMELISKEKSRNVTFKKRKEGLIRKMHEFTTLCDVSACMIIYGPKQEKGTAVEPDIWPQNADEIGRIIGIYKAKNKDSGNKTYCLSDFFHDRKRKVEEELSKLRKKNMETKYPTWLELLNFMTEAQLRDFSASLSNKADYVKSRIEFLRRNKQGFGLNLMDFSQARLSSQSHSFYSPVNPNEMPHVPIHYPTIDHTQDMHSMGQNNSMMMLLMNDNDQFVQFGGASSSTANIQSASYKRQVFYESRVGGYGLPQYYVPPPVLPPHVPCNMIQATAPLPPPPTQGQLSLKESNDGGQDDVVQYHMNNYKGRY